MEKLLNKLVYKEPLDLSRDEIATLLNQGENLCEVLISMGFNCDDFEFSKDMAFKFAKSIDVEIAGAALVAIGHLARRFENVDINEFRTLVKTLPLRKELSGRIKNTVDDIKIFCNKKT